MAEREQISLKARSFFDDLWMLVQFAAA